jgi:hypothetical protein
MSARRRRPEHERGPATHRLLPWQAQRRILAARKLQEAFDVIETDEAPRRDERERVPRHSRRERRMQRCERSGVNFNTGRAGWKASTTVAA